MVLGIITQIATATDRVQHQVDSARRRNGMANGHYADSYASEDLTVIEVSGRLRNSDEAQSFDDGLCELTQGSPHRVALDFSDLEYIDSHGLRVILMASQRIVRTGGKIVIYGAHGRVAKSIRDSGIDHIVPTFEDLDDVMAFFRLPSDV